MDMLTPDIIELKSATTYPVFTAKELFHILEFFGPADHRSIAIALMSSQIMRPVETGYLNWNTSFKYEDNGSRIIKMEHPSYKARNRLLKSNRTKITYLMLKKPMFSPWVSKQLISYRKTYGDCLSGQVFPWKTSSALNKTFTRLRQKHWQDLPFIVDRINVILKGEDKTQYRISPYSARRFAFTFHYWVTFNRDILSLCRFAGHANIETTWEYIYPKEAIGLTQEMIDRHVSWDEFVFGHLAGQMKLTESYTRGEIKIPIIPGQRSLLQYTSPAKVYQNSKSPLGIQFSK